MRPTAGVKALVLAAGYGTRLRPLTDHLPKPALPVLGLPMLAHTLRRLARCGVSEVAVNLHHLDERIPALLERVPDLPEIRFSFEEELLGTLGALGPLRDFFGDARAILVVNGDSLCRWPVRRLLRAHHRLSPAATLLLSSRADPARYGGGVGVGPERTVVSFRPGGPDGAKVRRVFAGAHVLSPRLLDRVPDGPADTITDLYEPLLAEGAALAACTTRRAWHDLGTPRRYLDGVVAWGRPWYRWPHRWVHREAEVAGGVRLRRAVVEQGATVERGARLHRALVLPGATVGAGCVLEDVIVGVGAEMPPRSRVTGRLVTRDRSDGHASPERSSRLGSLWYTPIESDPGARVGGEEGAS